MATPSRIAVARTLHLVFGEGARVPDAWDAGLPAADAGLANALLGQCLRRWGTLQAAIRPQLKDQSRGLPLGTQVSLAIGLAQLAWLPGVSDHAAVNEAVDLATSREVGFPPHKGLVNAILRRAAKDREALAAGLDAMDPALDRSPFTRRVLQAALAPRGGGGVEALWRRLQAPPHPHFRPLRAEPLPPGLEPSEILPGAFHLAANAEFPAQWLAAGAGMVQDLSSQALLSFRSPGSSMPAPPRAARPRRWAGASPKPGSPPWSATRRGPGGCGTTCSCAASRPTSWWRTPAPGCSGTARRSTSSCWTRPAAAPAPCRSTRS